MYSIYITFLWLQYAHKYYDDYASFTFVHKLRAYVLYYNFGIYIFMYIVRLNLRNLVYLPVWFLLLKQCALPTSNPAHKAPLIS